MVELVSVVEILPGPAVQAEPPAVSYWKEPGLWAGYRRQKFEAAGYSDQLATYREGFPFLEIAKIPEADLVLLLKQRLAQTPDQDQLVPFFGGYVLRVDDRDIMFPQCCGDLGDIAFWQSVADGKNDEGYYGHPDPIVDYDGEMIRLEFDESMEPFVPPCPFQEIVLAKGDLQAAVTSARSLMESFAARLQAINEKEQLGIDEIGERLVWGYRV